MHEVGGIGKYYSGKYICGVEMGVIIDANHTNPDGTNYDGNIAYILTYLPFEDACKISTQSDLFNKDLKKDYEMDYQTLIVR